MATPAKKDEKAKPAPAKSEPAVEKTSEPERAVPIDIPANQPYPTKDD